MWNDEETYGRNSVKESYVDLDKIEKEKKKLSPLAKKILLGTAAVVVIAVVAYVISYFMRPTVRELKDFNTLNNLVEKHGSFYMSTSNERGTEGSYFVKDRNHIQAANLTDYPDMYRLQLEYNDKRYTVSKDRETVYSYFSNTPIASLLQFESTFFNQIPYEDLDKKPSVKDGKYVYRYEQDFGTNTAYTEFHFNKDMSVAKISLNGIQIWNIEYGVQKDFFEPLKKFDLNDLVRVKLENLYEPDKNFEEQFMPRGMSVTGYFYAPIVTPDPESPDGNRYDLGILNVFADKACTIPFKDGDKDKPVNEDMTLYLNLPEEM